MKERIRLSDHFTFRNLLRFVFPSIVMMVFTSIYSVVDGFFVSNYAGKVPFAALNLIYPLLMILGAVGFMLGTGGSAIVSRTLGEGKQDLARRYFTLLAVVCLLSGLALVAVGNLVLRPLAIAFGASRELLHWAIVYGRICLAGIPCFMLQNFFQSFFVTAEKPQLGLAFTVCSGLANMVLDWLFVGVLGFGIAGAAAATVASQCVGGLGPLCYFLGRNDSLLRLVPTRWYGKQVLQACTNGSSELMSTIASSVVSILYNRQLLAYAGADGVAAYGVIMYVGFVFAAIFLGYAIGSAPLVGYQFGAGNKEELGNLRRKSLSFVAVTGAAMFVLAEALSRPLASLFVGYDASLEALTVHALRIGALCYLSMGCNIWASSFFTALNNGGVSALISFLRTLVFETGSVLLLPLLFGIEGIWWSTVAAEGVALVLSLLCLRINRPRYGY